ncbi:MAG: hypothetical protein M1832_005654 [Thelocarpon impressellum]|nr:MAG: hypothetical protein M1832_005654 [Thelocarpon impressellum]
MADAARLASIPLYCSICPKGPKFSDPSHLLTHVASKGHLSNHFKVSVRTSSDPAAKAKLDAYNRWYERYGIEQLLSQRMKKKDAKTARLEPKRESSEAAPAKKPRQQAARREGLEAYDLVGELIDPQLCHLNLGYDPRPETGPAPMTAAQHRAHTPRMQLWPGQTESTLAPKTERAPSCIPGSPLHGRASDRGLFDFAPMNLARQMDPFLDVDDPTPSSLSAPTADDDMDVDFAGGVKKGGAEAQLKGVCWPGMAIFDSATPEMKKKRNQKKDVSLALQLEICSTQVEATEQMFGTDGALKMERPISRLLEDSPTKTEPSLFEESHWTRGVLRETSSNGNQMNCRAIAADAGKAGANVVVVSRYNGLGTKRARTAASDAPPFGGLSFNPADDEDEEFKLIVGSAGKRKRGVAVFEDKSPSKPSRPIKATRPARTGNATDPRTLHDEFGNPRGFAFLNSGHSTPPMESGPVTDPFGCSRQPQPGIAWHGRSTSHTPGKENKALMLGSAGHIDEAGWVPIEPHRAYCSLEGGRAPDLYSSVPPQVDLGDFAGSGVFDFARDVAPFTFDPREVSSLSLGSDSWAPDNAMQQSAGETGELFSEPGHFWASVDDNGVGRLNYADADAKQDGTHQG